MEDINKEAEVKWVMSKKVTTIEQNLSILLTSFLWYSICIMNIANVTVSFLYMVHQCSWPHRSHIIKFKTRGTVPKRSWATLNLMAAKTNPLQLTKKGKFSDNFFRQLTGTAQQLLTAQLLTAKRREEKDCGRECFFSPWTFQYAACT